MKKSSTLLSLLLIVAMTACQRVPTTTSATQEAKPATTVAAAPTDMATNPSAMPATSAPSAAMRTGSCVPRVSPWSPHGPLPVPDCAPFKCRMVSIAPLPRCPCGNY